MRKTLLCALALLLAGCDKDFLSLHFDMPAGNLDYSQEVHAPLRDSILSPLKARNLPTDSLVMEIDAYNARVVHLRLKDDSLSPQQLDEIREVYEAIIPARNAVTLMMRLTFDTTQLQALDINRQPTGKPPTGFDPALLAPMVRTIVLTSDIGNPPYANSAVRLEQGSDGQMLCSLNAHLGPNLPFKLVSFTPSESGPGDHGLVHLLSAANERLQVPVRMAFSDGTLHRQVQDGTLRVLLSAKDWGDLKTPAKDRLHFVLGPPLTADKPAAHNASLRVECLKRMNGIGRPFTFFMGDNIDRLNYVGLPPQD